MQITVLNPLTGQTVVVLVPISKPKGSAGPVQRRERFGHPVGVDGD